MLPGLGRHRGVYVIGVVKQLTGLSERQIRYYEDSGLVQPQRTTGNQRLYSPVDVERLLRIKMKMGRGFTIEQVKGCLSDREAGGERWIEAMRRQVWDKGLYQRAHRLRDLAALRALVDYRRHHPPSIDRLYRGGMGTAVSVPAANSMRLYPPGNLVLMGALHRSSRRGQAGSETDESDR